MTLAISCFMKFILMVCLHYMVACWWGHRIIIQYIYIFIYEYILWWVRQYDSTIVRWPKQATTQSIVLVMPITLYCNYRYKFNLMYTWNGVYRSSYALS